MGSIAYREQLDGLVRLFATVAIGPKWGDDDIVQTIHLMEETRVLRSSLWAAAENALQAHSCLASQREQLEKVSADIEQATGLWRQLCDEVKDLKSAKRTVKAGEKAKMSQLAFGELFALQGKEMELEAFMHDLESSRVSHSQKQEAMASAKLDAAKVQLKELQ
jgi:hypothetical protein